MAGMLRKKFTNEEIISAIGKHKGDLTLASEELSKLGRGCISRQLLRYWDKHLNTKKRNGQPYVGTTVLDRKIRSDMKLRNPSKEDDKAPEQGELQYQSVIEDGTEHPHARLLIIPDMHSPYHHPQTVEFLKAVAAKYNPTRVINLGDEVDNHALSFHDSDPNLDSAGAELAKARSFIKLLSAEFPRMDIMHSNHGSLVYRRALKSGIPVEYIKSYRDILFPDGKSGNGWSWHDQLVIDLPDGSNILFAHHMAGNPIDAGARNRCSTCFGHLHGKYDISYSASETSLWFAMRSGCLIDASALAFAYGKLFREKPIVGCSVIINSQPMLVPMVLDEQGRWNGELN